VYVLSLVFLLASVISLLVGVQGGGLVLVFSSIGFSVLAALFLGASVLRRRSEQPPEEEIPGSRVEDWRSPPIPSPRSSGREEQRSSEETGGPLARESLVGVVDRPIAGRHGGETETSGSHRTDPSEDRVLGPEVIVSDHGTYHVRTCPLARGHHFVEMKRATAQRLGYTPCGVCGPG
jgi:hypothetical protein